ncbi:MAG TPA: polyprenol monophosphomannose synthase [Vicinamibacterales bacterium]|nr:polyprenol monophosphomannose synthase [Vicinamibacterales bacterium]
MKALILVPTYNERENLPVLAAGLLAIPDVAMLVIDDASPDGTGQIADGLARQHPGRVQVMHRAGPRGLGRSYLDGFRAAVAGDADVVCQMDADLSHDPRFLPSMLAAIDGGAELVIGSRYRAGGRVENWPLRRRLLSAFANRYIRMVTGMHVRDCTSGYRCWRRTALARLQLDSIASEGYAFLTEIIFQAAAAGIRIAEVPIVFVERRQGASKLSSAVLLESLITPWRLARRNGRISYQRTGIGHRGTGNSDERAEIGDHKLRK